MSFQNPVKLPVINNDESSLGTFREWLMAGGNPNEVFDGRPLFLWLLENEWHEAVAEAWEAGANANARDARGQGWLHRVCASNAPTWLAMEGFRRLDHTWWHPDEQGHTPFHVPVFDKRLGQAMIVRWWTEQRPWRVLQAPFDPQHSQLPQARAWRAWTPLLRP